MMNSEKPKQKRRPRRQVLSKQKIQGSGWFTGQSLNRWIGILIVLCIVIFALMMTGCATSTPPSSVRSPLPSNLTSECPMLTKLDDGTGAAVTRKLIEVSEMYYECRNKHIELTKAVSP